MKLSQKISYIFGASILRGVIIAALFGYFAIGIALVNRIAENQQAVTVSTMDKIDRFIFERGNEAERLAQEVPLYPANAVLLQTFKSHTKVNTLWNNFCLIDTSGKTTVAVDPRDIGHAFMRVSPEFPRLYSQALHNKTVYSTALQLSDESEPTVAIFTPVHDKNGAVTGVLAGEVNWDTIENILSDVKHADAVLIDASGIEVGTNAPNKAAVLKKNWSSSALMTGLRGYSGARTVLGPGLDDPGIEHLVTYVRQPGYESYKGVGWTFVVTASMTDVMAPARQVSLLLGSILFVSLLISMISMVFILTRHVSGPLRKLTAAARRISEGEIKQFVTIHSADEIGELSQSFNLMSSQLAASHSQIEEERARLNSSIQNLPIGFMLTDTAGKIVTVNHMITKILGAESGALSDGELKVGEKCSVLYQKILAAAERAMNEKHLIKIKEFENDNSIFRIFAAPVLHEDNTIGAVLLVEDITESIIMARSRDEFFSIASHELRTPLTAIRGNTSMIQNYYATQLKDPELNDMIGDIHESSLRLIEIVNDFLDTSRLELNKMHFTFEPVDIVQIIEQVVYEMAALSQAKKVTLRLENDLGSLPKVRADKNRLKQVVYNLVGNAMKFVEKGGVTIAINKHADKLYVRVTDTGPGISPENQKLLFHKFQQATSSILTRDATHGTGLGLYISKMIVEKMDGKIMLEKSELGVGSTFSFTVPVAKDAKDDMNEAKK